MEKLKSISNHAYERYVQRIMGYTEQCDINRYISQNKELITERINKLYQYSEQVYEGQAIKGKEHQKVFVKDTWVLIVSPSETLITLFESNFPLGDEFNKTFIESCVKKLQSLHRELDELNGHINENIKSYSEEIEFNKERIKELHKEIRMYEDRNKALDTLKSTELIPRVDKEQEIKDVVNTLCSKKMF
jgi:hypothetical protein